MNVVYFLQSQSQLQELDTKEQSLILKISNATKHTNKTKSDISLAGKNIAHYTQEINHLEN